MEDGGCEDPVQDWVCRQGSDFQIQQPLVIRSNEVLRGSDPLSPSMKPGCTNSFAFHKLLYVAISDITKDLSGLLVQSAGALPCKEDSQATANKTGRDCRGSPLERPNGYNQMHTNFRRRRAEGSSGFGSVQKNIFDALL